MYINVFLAILPNSYIYCNEICHSNLGECPINWWDAENILNIIQFSSSHIRAHSRFPQEPAEFWSPMLLCNIIKCNVLRKLYIVETNTRHWGVGDDDDFKGQRKPYWYRKKPNALAVETTSYALLTYLQYHDIDACYPIVRWLTQQRKTDGSFVSTQVSLQNTYTGAQSLDDRLLH